MRKTGLILLFIFIISELFCCTIGVINGSATADGRPVIWKSREAGANVQMMYEDNYTLQYIGSGNSGSDYAWMGINEAGLAIANAMVGDLDRLPGNGDCMLQALRNYSTIAEFITFLDSTNVSGRETHTNYVMMDATGAAVVLEVGSNEYWLYDTADTEYGFIVRDNFSLAGGGISSTKYELINSVLTDMAVAGDIVWQDIFPTIITGFYDEEQNQVELPFAGRWDVDDNYGYLNSADSNNGLSNSSVTLIHGSAPGEPAWLSTMWTMLGYPTCSIALPYWAVCPAIPQPASGDPTVPLTNRATQIRQIIYNASPYNWVDSYMLSNSENTGYWDTILPFMQEKFELISSLREDWVNEPPAINELQSCETSICQEGYELVMNWELNSEVVADFACDEAQGELPFTVHFNDKSLHAPDSLAWDFELDGVIDSVMTHDLGLGVERTYEEAGTYDVALYAYKDEIIDSLIMIDYITAFYPDIDYLEVEVDTVIFDLEEPYYKDIYLYNSGNCAVELQEFFFTDLEGYPNPSGGELFWWEFVDENLELPVQMVAGDSCQIRLVPFMPTREYWGQTLVMQADLDTLLLPCLYDENLWQNNEPESIILPAVSLNNYPNPFNPTTNIEFNIPEPGYIDLAIYNLKGQKVKTLISQQMQTGNSSFIWEGKNDQEECCGSGIYFIQLAIDGKLQLLKRCVLLK